MKEFDGKNIIIDKIIAMRTFSYNFSDISFDISKELSGVIFSLHFNLPNVADC